MEEIWKDIQGYEGKYQISSLGRVKCIYKGKNYLRITTPNSRKYHCIILSKDRKQRGYLVHRLVAIHFIDNPNNYEYVNHKSFDKNDNSVSNLEWCTHQQNIDHAKTGGRFIINKPQRPKKQKPEKIYSKYRCYKLTKENVLDIRFKYSQGVSIRQLHNEYGTTYNNIYMAATRKTWANI